MTSHLNSSPLLRRAGNRLAALLAALAFAALAYGQAARTPPKPSAPLDFENAQIVRLEHRWLNAQDTGNVAALGKILAADFARPNPATGRFITKKQIMAYLHSHPFPHHAGPTPRFTQLRVRLYGNVAIARGVLTARDAHGALGRKTLFTDVFVRRRGRWQAVSAQENHVPSR